MPTSSAADNFACRQAQGEAEIVRADPATHASDPVAPVTPRPFWSSAPRLEGSGAPEITLSVRLHRIAVCSMTFRNIGSSEAFNISLEG